ncbi:MAG TPA: GDP-mannose 4,6-dehydratase [Ferruginibacter sp.]|nr:GDP-mannose 4,6-dehydratase [Ferruginibacter sp.]HMP21956.1 GDP-mannose 4,6-dehydratase [Ferruginibacter sp.]
MNAIIFGANGQDGFYLSQLLEANNYEVHKIGRNDNVSLLDYKSLCSLFDKTKPKYIFHLAANSTTNHNALFENHDTISTGTVNILEAVKNFSPGSKVFISGSGLQFVNYNKPIKETDAFEARDAYSVSRIHSVYAARYYRRLGINAYVGYFFNHDSPLRSERHMAKKISTFAQMIAAGSDKKLEIGDINTVKEWAFAGDIVKGIMTLVQQAEVLEANISSGMGYSIKDWLKACFALTGKNWEEHVILKNDFVAEYKSLVSDPSRIFSLGWKPETSFEQLASMMMQPE